MRIVAAFLVAGSLIVAARAAEEPWDAAFLTSDPATLLKAAAGAAAPGNVEAVMLLDDASFVFEQDGRQTTRAREVYRVLTARGVEDRGSTNVFWAPWHQERPKIEARVVTADGVEHRLDPASITEAPARQDAELYSDAKALRAHLPAVAIGAVVELQITVVETQTFAGAGSQGTFSFGSDVPVEHTRLLVDAPAGLPLRYELRSMPGMEPRREEKDGRVRVTFETGHLDARPVPEAHLPADVVRRPHVTIATGSSWADLARIYEGVVAERIGKEDSEIEAIAKKAIAGEKDRSARITRLLALLGDVRYTGIELGRAALVPAAPATTFKRKYGDCKDKAAALVSLLRAADIDARVALLHAGFEEDVEKDLPSLSGFNHAIVYVVDDPPMWIDPTDEFAPAGELPDMDQGRYALVADRKTAGLVRTPEEPADVCRVVETREVTFGKDGPGRIVETRDGYGGYGRSFRRQNAETSTRELNEHRSKYVEAEFLGDAVGSEPVDTPRLLVPFRERIEAAQARLALHEKGEASVGAPAATLLRWLPNGIQAEPGTPPREADFLGVSAFRIERRYVITPPPGYSTEPLPRPVDRPLGPARYREEWHEAKDDKVEGTLILELAKRRLTAAELTALREALDALKREKMTVLRFRESRRAK
ncbi:MAG: DUF3857 and transglutaminase domain-containing protein [Acidobacteriota bacterium]